MNRNGSLASQRANGRAPSSLAPAYRGEGFGRGVVRVVAVVLVALALCSSTRAQHVARTITSFDPDWKFLQADAASAHLPGFDDSAWARVDVPHDWAIAGPFVQDAASGSGGAYAPSGVSWYRKTFTLPADQRTKRHFIEFDGVMANSDVWINGIHVGRRPFGYISFGYDLTGTLRFGEGQVNVLAVKTDTSVQPDSRWYTGQGIYRHVRLITSDTVHVPQWATFVTTPHVSGTSATVNIKSSVANNSITAKQVTIQTKLIGPDGTAIEGPVSGAQTIAPRGRADFEQSITVNAPKIWDTASPNLYKAVVSVSDGEKTIDDDVVSFGIRTFEFKTESGFWLNGKNLKLLGVCLHHDGGAFGAAVPDAIWEYRLENLRKLGVNAIRTAHNPPSPAFLDICDRMGFLVMDEAFDVWTVGKRTGDYHLFFNEWHLHDLADMVKRDRNHPSVVLYSTGNEIHDTPREALALSILKPMVEEFHKHDPTRPVTQALFRPNVSNDYTNGLADMLDVIGTNYRDAELLQAWRDKPGRKIVGTEQQHGLDTWLHLRDNPQHSGQFLWAGIDYMGENVWPNITYFNGLLDRTGAVKNNGLQRQAWWGTQPVVHMVRAPIAAAAPPAPVAPPAEEAGRGARGARGARGGRGGGGGGRGAADPVPDWTPVNPAPDARANISVYSNTQSVELFLNDTSLGAKDKPADDSPRTWQVPFATGVLKAVGKNGGQVVATSELRTAGAPAKILITTHRDRLAPVYDDVAVVTAQVVDANGVPCPNVTDVIKFNITGPGIIAAVDNGNLTSREPFHASERPAYRGRVVAFVKANAPSGQISVTATADGVAAGSTTIQATAAK